MAWLLTETERLHVTDRASSHRLEICIFRDFIVIVLCLSEDCFIRIDLSRGEQSSSMV